MHEFFICLNKHGIQHIEGQNCAFKRGRAFMLYSDCRHQMEFEPDADSEFIFVCFDKNHLAKSGYLHIQEQLENRQKQGCYFSGDEPEYLEFNVNTIKLLHNEISSSGLLQNELINALLVQLLVAFLRNTNLETSSTNSLMNKKRSNVAKLCKSAAMDSSIEMTLAQAACKTGTCRSVFAALVKETTGLSWREYILDCRLKKSIDLLATTDKQILEVAFECNFNNIAYFHRSFLKKYGNTPSKMRKALQQNRFPHIIKEYR
jgi:AraC-like DNA-binding protein